jgi:hypothetical protein
MKGDVINEFSFGHSPRIIFVKDVGLAVKVIVELIQHGWGLCRSSDQLADETDCSASANVAIAIYAR